MQDVPVWENPTPEIFRSEIAPLARPALLRGIAGDWPLVKLARQSDAACMAALTQFASDAPIDVVRTAPENEGRFHYSDDLRGVNFARAKASLPAFLRALEAEATKERPHAMSAQGVLARDAVPDFAASHPMPYVPQGADARLWIGNAAKVASHNDPSDNIAVCAGGRRRFTLFPPDQIGNLYIGPLHFTPAGTPISMVHVTKPDLARYPRFAEAMKTAWAAELEPGDALFIPYAWYHHVEALEAFNILVNYWWNDARDDLGSPWDAMLHGMMSLRSLSADQREAWRAMFDHYVFLTDGDPAAHLPPHAHGVLGASTPEDIGAMREQLKALFAK
ncbi:MAG: cupin-like domain-containing protein [Sphingopyxis sp.]